MPGDLRLTGLHQRNLSDDIDLGGRRADLHLDVEGLRLIVLEQNTLEHRRIEALHGHANGELAWRQRRHAIVSDIRGSNYALDAGRQVLHRHFRVGDCRVGRIADPAFNNTCKLGLQRRWCAEYQRNDERPQERWVDPARSDARHKPPLSAQLESAYIVPCWEHIMCLGGSQ